MTMALSHAAPRGPAAHARPVNFGQLNSAIARGDLAAAQTAFTALNGSSAPAAMAAKARGPLDGLGTAIASGDVAAARQSLADFRAGRVAPPATTRAPTLTATPAPVSPPVPDVIPLPAESTTAATQITTLLSGTGSTVSTFA